MPKVYSLRLLWLFEMQYRVNGHYIDFKAESSQSQCMAALRKQIHTVRRSHWQLLAVCLSCFLAQSGHRIPT